MIQGTLEWLAARAGKFTASTAKDLLTQGRGGQPSKTRETLLLKLAAERLAGHPFTTPTTYAMERGKVLEPEARAFYALMTGQDVQEVGFMQHPTHEIAGCSPDGLVGEKGLIEIKCPLVPEKHMRALLGDVDDEYTAQRQFQMWVTDREWCDAVSFHPDFPTSHQLAIVRVPRDPDWQTRIADAVTEAELQLSDIMAKLAK